MHSKYKKHGTNVWGREREREREMKLKKTKMCDRKMQMYECIWSDAAFYFVRSTGAHLLLLLYVCNNKQKFFEIREHSLHFFSYYFKCTYSLCTVSFRSCFFPCFLASPSTTKPSSPSTASSLTIYSIIQNEKKNSKQGEIRQKIQGWRVYAECDTCWCVVIVHSS